MGLGYSKDMVHWEKYPGNPVLSPGEHYDSNWVGYPSVMFDSPLYKMWYTGQQIAGNIPYAIDYTTSNDGIHWTKYAENPVVTGETPTIEKHVWAQQPDVLKADSKYLMLLQFDYNVISYVTSSNGLSWNTTGLPLMEWGNTSSWDYDVAFPSFLLSNTRLTLYYTGSQYNAKGFSAIGVTYCNFVVLQTTATTTVTKNSFTTLTTTEQVPIPEPPVYQTIGIVLAVMAVALSFVLLTMCRRLRK